MNRKLVISYVSIFLLLIGWFLIQQQHIDTITYFPRDDQIIMQDAHTSLEICQDGNKVCVQTHSKTDEKINLRQDITLVFVHFHVHSLFYKWKENTDIIDMKQTLQIPKNSYIHIISYYHGEIEQNEQYTTVAKMTAIEKFYDGRSFKMVTPIDKKRMEANYYQKMQDAMADLQIDASNYDFIPLFVLPSYDEAPFPHMTQEKTNKIIGQLWEGLYKNYFLPMIDDDQMQTNLMPLILLAKNQSHLLVLYEKDGQFKVLRQNL